MAGFQINGVECEPLWDGYQEGFDQNGPTVTVPYLTDWDSRWPLLRAIRGSSSTIGPSSPWNRVKPYAYEDSTIGQILYATNAWIKPEGNVIIGSDPFRATHAIVSVTFGVLSYNVDFVNDPFFLNSLSQDAEENEALQYATQSIEYGAEWIKVPNGSVGFLDGVKLDTPISKRMTIHNMSITWHRYPLMPMGRLRDYADVLNDATFLGCPRGTVLFAGPKIKRDEDMDGMATQQVTMDFKWRPIDWNYVLRPDTGQFEELIYGGDTTKHTYNYKNFKNLLLRA